MKKAFFTIFITLFAFTVNAQSDTSANRIYLAFDKAPEFPGGTGAFVSFLEKTIRYPIKARTRGKDGKVLVTFVIEKDGSITNGKILRSVDDDIDAEVLRVVNLSPKWNPGTVNGVPVRSQFTYPINFKRPINIDFTH
ncbi:energy transducer TonB [Mucilaginibacter sp. HD30]